MRTSAIRSPGLCNEVLIPRLEELVTMLGDDSFDLRQFPRRGSRDSGRERLAPAKASRSWNPGPHGRGEARSTRGCRSIAGTARSAELSASTGETVLGAVYRSALILGRSPALASYDAPTSIGEAGASFAVFGCVCPKRHSRVLSLALRVRLKNAVLERQSAPSTARVARSQGGAFTRAMSSKE